MKGITKRTNLKAILQDYCKQRGYPVPLAELQFCDGRKWAFDLCWPITLMYPATALEIEGGVWSGGRHTRGKGFMGDMEKYNEATFHGWRLLRTTPGQIESGETFALIDRLMKQRGRV